MQSNLVNYSVKEQLCVHSLACMSMDMDWNTYEQKFINSQLSQLRIESVAEGYDVIYPNAMYIESLRELPKSDKKSTLSIARRLVALSVRPKTESNASHSNSIQSSCNINSMEPASTSTPQRRSKRKIKPTKRFHSPGFIEDESPEKKPVSRRSVIIKTEDASHQIAGSSGLSSTSTVTQIKSVNPFYLEYESSEEDSVPQDSVTINAENVGHEIAGPSRLSSTSSATQIESVNPFHSSDYLEYESSEEDPVPQDSDIIKTKEIAGSRGKSSKLSGTQIESVNENNKRLLLLGKLLREKKTIKVFNQPKANLILDKKDAKKLLQNRDVRHSRLREFSNINPNRSQPNPFKVIDVDANNAKKQRLDDAIIAEKNQELILDLARKLQNEECHKRFLKFMRYKTRTQGPEWVERFQNDINIAITRNSDRIEGIK